MDEGLGVGFRLKGSGFTVLAGEIAANIGFLGLIRFRDRIMEKQTEEEHAQRSGNWVLKLQG